MPLANLVHCICFDLFIALVFLLYFALYAVGFFFSLSSVAVKKKLPFFGCRFFCTHIFLFGFCMDMSSIRLPCLDLPCASVVYASWLLFIWFSNRKSYNISRKNEKQKKWINPITEQKYIYTSHFCGIACRYFFSSFKAKKRERENGRIPFWKFTVLIFFSCRGITAPVIAPSLDNFVCLASCKWIWWRYPLLQHGKKTRHLRFSLSS